MSNVVKAERAESFRTAPFFDLSDIEAQAAAVISAAQARAAAVLEAARVEAEAARKRAAEEGRRAGAEQGRAEGRRLGAEEAREDAYAKAHDEIADLTSALVKALEDFSARKEALFVQAQKDLLDLALLVAKKVIAREVAADAHVTSDNLKRCLSVLSSHRNLVVRVAPQVLETVSARLPDTVKSLGIIEGIRVEADAAVAPGGCLITGERGMLDATVDTQLAEAERILFGEEHE